MRYLAVLVVVLGSLVPCQAQNLLPNPEFDHDVSGWTLPPFYPNTLLWDPSRNAFGVGGSAQLTTSFGIGASLTTTACVPVTPGVTYSWGGQYLFPNTGAESLLVFELDFTNGPGCTSIGPSYTSTQYASQNPPETWRTLAGPDATAPAGATGALFSVTIESNGDSLTHAVNFDDVYFGRKGTVGPNQASAIPALSLPGLFALALGLSLAALWALSKRSSKKI